MLKSDVIKKIEELRTKGAVFVSTQYNQYIIKKETAVNYEVGRMEWFDGCSGLVWYGDIVSVTDKKPLVYDETNGITVGSDPELFFVNDKGNVVPSNLVVPSNTAFEDVIRDGFQGELNPKSSSCRQTAGSNIAHAFLRAVRYAKDVGATVSLKVGHVITDDVWETTPRGMRRFGCNPTLNVHETNFKRVTGSRERFRAAGGHVHLGLPNKCKVDLAKVVALMDIYAGNTCVLIDRDPDNARRRKNYGRAGEHRVKTYGVEYRVLSNFWLRSYTLWSMVSVLCRNAVDIHYIGYADELLGRFDMKKVRKAINDNDFELAKENFEILRTFIKEHQITGSGLDVTRVDKFYNWATAKEDPLTSWNTLDKTIRSWKSKTMTNGMGFEAFIHRKK